MRKFFVSDALDPGVSQIEIWANSHQEAAEGFAEDDYDMDYSLGGHPVFVENEAGERKKFLIEWDPDFIYSASELPIS